MKRTKAKVLSELRGTLKHAQVLDQVCFTVQAWQKNPENILADLKKKDWSDKRLIVRSSSLDEDTLHTSNAGRYDSILNVEGSHEVAEAIKKVASSFSTSSLNHEIFIQPMLENVKISGVAFTRDPSTNAPYIKINYDDKSGLTDTITSGSSQDSETFYFHRHHNIPDSALASVINMCFEVEEKLELSPLDIEFAIDAKGVLYLFQARPLLIPNELQIIDDEAHYHALENIEARLSQWMKKHPYLHGNQGMYGLMPDWNPAEIIGVRPKPLAVSLYRELVTNSIWAYQRDNYGYKELRSFPLLLELEGLPYIDIRVSFNSFIPKTLDDTIAKKLANYYLQKLYNNPHLHDKVEFDIVFSCYTFSTSKNIELLKDHGFSTNDIGEIKKALKSLTTSIICNKSGLWKKDLDRVHTLEKKMSEILSSDLDPFAKIFWLVEDCKRYGTLPFAGLARAGFIAVEFLKSFVVEGILSQDEYDAFMASLNTISSSITRDQQELSKQEFLKKYGHLRPGTYDILSKTYEENFQSYFSDKANQSEFDNEPNFRLSLKQLNTVNTLLKENGFEIDAIELLNFIKGAIEAREYSKFIFTKSVSKTLDLYKEVCQDMGIAEEEAAFTHIGSILSLNSIASDPKSILQASINRRKKRFDLTRQIILPPLIRNSCDVFAFHEPNSTPNFVTQKKVNGEVWKLTGNDNKQLTGKIVLIENADPGYDWLFSHNIAGLVTKYGGANSHMAIRSGELGIPSIIGAGPMYDKIAAQKYVAINCLEKKVEYISS